MPFGYLVTVAIAAVHTAFAVAPPRPRRSSRSNVAFWLGSVVNEVPVLVVAWLLAATLPAAAQGDLDSPVGAAGLGLAVVTMAGVGVVVRRGLLAGPAVERALRDGLGDGWRGAVDPAMASRPRVRRPSVLALLAPFPLRPRGVERLRGIAYGDAGRRNLLDVYRHRSRPAGAPVLVHLHGGGFRMGGRSREARALLHGLARMGWVCISANYRLRRAAPFPEDLIDVKRVLAWVRRHGHEHGADPGLVVVAGSSAGAHLAALAALTPDDPALQPGFEDEDTSVAAAVCLYGYYGPVTSRAGRPSAPPAYVGPDAPPFLIAHGDRDTLTRVEEARGFAARLRELSSAPVVYAELPGGQHGFDLVRSPRFEAVVDGVAEFGAWVRSSRAAQPSSAARSRS